MKKINFFAIFMTVILLGFQSISLGQALLDENFAYPAGDLITAHGWASHSGAGTQAITVAASGLTFPGYIDSGIGNAALVDNNGEDDNKTFTTQTSGVVYSSFMVNVTTSALGYFYHFSVNPINTTFRGRVYMNTTNHFGLGVGSNAATYAAATFTPGTTYLLVLKYEIVPGTINDKVSLFVFDGPLPVVEPAIPTIGPLTDITQADINPGSVALRQFINTQNLTIDGIRVATTWNDVLGNAPQQIPTVSEWGLIFLVVALMGIGVFYIVRRRNSALSV
ncbi:MAG: IPTL-CTERM sorting domain-containing protein [Bacteroidales bacterium]